MAHIRLQRQAEVDIVLEYGRELGAISDGAPVVRDEYRLRGIQGHHCLDLSGVKSLEQRRDNVFGFSWEWKALRHRGSPVRLVETVALGVTRSAPLDDAVAAFKSLCACPIP